MGKDRREIPMLLELLQKHCSIRRFSEKEVPQKLLGLPTDCLPSEILAFVHPASEAKPRKKKTKEEIVFYNEYAK